EAPVWSSKLCSGFPIAAGNPLEPLSLVLFATQPIARALCLLVIALILVAAHGAYGLARRVGADRSGAVLAGIAFAGSGYLVTQLKHLGIVSTVVWLPWGLLLIDCALANRKPPALGEDDVVRTAPPSLSERFFCLGLFGAVYAEQIASGFPQSAYISGVTYGLWAVCLLVQLRGKVGRVPLALVLFASLAFVSALAVACGAPSMLPLFELAAHSDRSGKLSFEFASMLPYGWRDLLNFLIPYANGDIADLSYRGKGLFWENYGYVGVATVLLAFGATARAWRRPRVLLLVGLAVGCMAMVLGRQTPLFYFAWKYVPGMSSFRFPTRFLVVVDLMLAILGAIGLRYLRLDLERLLSRVAPRIPALIPPCVVFGTALDLFAHQTHQNPYVLAQEWLEPPAAVSKVADRLNQVRFYSPLHKFLHQLAYQTARGWTTLDPYRELRQTVAPNTGVYYGVATADCYAGIAPKWYVDAWGDHSRRGLLVPQLTYLSGTAIVLHASLPSVLAAYGVTHLLAPLEIRGAGLREERTGGAVRLYELPGRRVRVVPTAQVVSSSREAVTTMTRPDFDADRLVLLHTDPPTAAPAPLEGGLGERVGSARIVKDEATRVRIEVDAPQGGYLVLSDTYYPGWLASVDGRETPIHRANISVRSVKLPPGARSVEFTYEAAMFRRGLMLGMAAFACLLAWILAAACFHRTRLQSR
ncbi:MAG: YfhO family protein, partial [Myxococcales bacterium]